MVTVEVQLKMLTHKRIGQMNRNLVLELLRLRAYMLCNLSRLVLQS